MSCIFIGLLNLMLGKEGVSKISRKLRQSYSYNSIQIKLHLKANRCNKFNQKFISNMTCRVRSFNRSIQRMTYITNFHPGVQLYEFKVRNNNLNCNLSAQWMILQINITSYRKFGMAYRPSLIHIREDWCAAMNGSVSHYLNAMLPSFRKYGNIVKPCPISVSVKSFNFFESTVISEVVSFLY